jgi:hypothetical protein
MRRSPPSIFHGFRARFLHEANGVAHGFLRVIVVAAVGHVRHEQRAPRAAPHGARVMQHFFHRDRQRALIAQHHHRQRIADQQDVHACFVQQPRRRIVVRRQTGDFCR